MADNTNGGQMNFSSDLSALSQFIATLRRFSQQNQQIAPEIKDLTTLLKDLNSVINTLGKSFRSVERLDSGQVRVFRDSLRTLLKLIPDLNNAMNAFGNNSNDKIKEVNNSLRLLNTTVKSMTKLSDRMGSPAEIQKIESSMQALTRILGVFIKEVNAMSVDSAKFTQLGTVLRELNQTVTQLNVAQGRANQQQRLSQQGQLSGLNQLAQSYNQTRQQATGLLGLFTGSSGRGPLSWLTSMHMGINNLRFSLLGLATAFGGRELWNFLIGTNQQIEVLQASLEVTLKSAEKAKETINFLRSYAALTPFQELETFKAGEMLAANRMQVDRWVQVAGDLASAKRTAGVQLEDVINVLTRINSGDFGKAMIRLRQMGISLNDLREQGLEFTKNNTFKGTTDQMLNAIEFIVNQRFGGLTQKLGQTVEGLISTIKDFFLQLGIEMGDKSFKNLKSFLIWLRDILKEFRNSNEFKKLVADVNSFIDSIKSGLSPWIAIITKFIKFVADTLPLIGTVVKTLLYTTLFNTVINFVRGILTGATNIASNWRLINIETARQNTLLATEGAQLNSIALQLARINALRQAGVGLLTQETAAQAGMSQMMLIGGNRTALAGRNITTAQQRVVQQAQALKDAGKEAEAVALLNRSGIDPAMMGMLAIGGAQNAVGATAMTNQLNRQNMLRLYDEAIKPGADVNTIKQYKEAQKAQIALLSESEKAKYGRDLRTAGRANVGAGKGAPMVTIPPPEAAPPKGIKGMASVAGIGSFLGSLMSVATVLTAVALAIGGIIAIINLVKGSTDRSLQKTTEDWERIIEAENEETNALKNLNATRMYAIDRIEYYDTVVKKNTDSLNEARKANDGSTESKEREHKAQQVLTESTNQLNSVKEQLNLTNQRMIEIDVSLANTLLNSSNALSNQTEQYRLNTEAIKKNIAAREQKAYDDRQIQIATAENEKQEALKKIDTLKAVLNNATGYQELPGWMNVPIAAGNLMGQMMPYDPATKELMQKTTDILRLPRKTDEEKKYYETRKSELLVEIDTQRKIVEKSNKMIEEPQKLIKEGWYRQTSDNIPLLKGDDKTLENLLVNRRMTAGQITEQINRLLKGQPVTDDFIGFEDKLKHAIPLLMEDKDRKLRADKNKGVPKDYEALRENPVEYLNEFLKPTDDIEKRIKAKHQAKIQDALLNAGGNTASEEYQSAQDAMYKELADFYQTQIDSLTEMATNNRLNAQMMIDATSKEDLQNLVKAGMSVDELMQAVTEFRSGGVSAIRGEMAKFKKEVEALAEYGDAEQIKKTFSEAFGNIEKLYESQKEIEYQLNIARGNKSEALANTLKGEKKAQQRTAYQEFTDEWEKKRQMQDVNKDILLQNTQLQGYSEESQVYKVREKSSAMSVRNFIINEMSRLRELIGSGKIKEDREKFEAQLKLLQLQKESNQLLLDIKKNTTNLAEFNKPGIVKAMTYYDYKAKDTKSSTISIGDAKFIMQIDAPQKIEDVESMMDLIKKYLGNYIKEKEFSGVKNQEVLR